MSGETVAIIIFGFVLFSRRGGWPRWGRQAPPVDQAMRGELDELRQRVDELEGSQGRMAELEERLDFTERMLIEGRAEAPRVGGS